ncbi:hypothetical protein CF335_g9612, partial [Tilletia laevis]
HRVSRRAQGPDQLSRLGQLGPRHRTPRSARFTGGDSPEEEEFNIEIPDEEADAITSVQQAIDYVSHAPEAV